MIKNFTDLFKKKKEESMQDRAEKSRETKEIEEKFDQTYHNLNSLLDEITKKKNQNG